MDEDPFSEEPVAKPKKPVKLEPSLNKFNAEIRDEFRSLQKKKEKENMNPIEKKRYKDIINEGTRRQNKYKDELQKYKDEIQKYKDEIQKYGSDNIAFDEENEKIEEQWYLDHKEHNRNTEIQPKFQIQSVPLKPVDENLQKIREVRKMLETNLSVHPKKSYNDWKQTPPNTPDTDYNIDSIKPYINQKEEVESYKVSENENAFGLLITPYNKIRPGFIYQINNPQKYIGTYKFIKEKKDFAVFECMSDCIEKKFRGDKQQFNINEDILDKFEFVEVPDPQNYGGKKSRKFPRKFRKKSRKILRKKSRK